MTKKKPIPTHLLRPIFSATDITTMFLAFIRIFDLAREHDMKLGMAHGLNPGDRRYQGDTDLAQRLRREDLAVIVGTMNRMLGFTDEDLQEIRDGIDSSDTWEFAKRLFAGPGAGKLKIGDPVPEEILYSSHCDRTPDA